MRFASCRVIILIMWDNLYSRKLRLAVTKTTKEISEILIKTRLNQVNNKIIEVLDKWEEPMITNRVKTDEKYFEEDIKDFEE